MELALIIFGLWILYSRTWLGENRSYYIIDDIVRRWGYLYDVPAVSPPPAFYSTKPHPWRHFFLILTHCLNVWVIHELFGWQVAALFAFCPLSVNGTAWITGGYYAVTMFLSLTAYYFIVTFQNIFGMLAGSLFFTAALGSTITCIGIPFIFLVTGTPLGVILFWPLAMYLFGKRFRTGFAIRNHGKKDPITFRKIAVCTKVMAYYIYLTLFPNKLSFFKKFGYNYTKNPKAKKEMDSFNKLFYLSLLVVSTFAYVGWQISPLGTAWFLITLAPFTQFKVLGQFVAERYLYLPQLGVHLILAKLLSPYPIAYAVLLTLYIYRSHLYIPAFRNIAALYKNGIQNEPDCISNYANLGERYLHLGQTHRALRLFQDGLKIDPMDFLCHVNLAAYWISVQSYDMALFHTKMAMADPDNALHHILVKQHNELINHIQSRKEFRVKELKRVEEESKILSNHREMKERAKSADAWNSRRQKEEVARKPELPVLSLSK